MSNASRAARLGLKEAAEIVGIVAVVLSLVFLGYEQKRANDIAEAEAIASMMAEFNAFSSLVASDTTLWRVWSEGSADYAALNAPDKARFAHLANYLFNIYEMSFAYIGNDLVDSAYVERFTGDFCALLKRNDGIGRAWARLDNDGGAGLATVAKTRCADVPTDAAAAGR